MNKPKPGIFVRFLLVSSLAVSAALLFFYLFQFLPSQRQLRESHLIARARAVCELSSRNLARALETRDDLALVGALEDIKKLDDISSVYILDAAGKVLAHDRIGEWNRTYADPASKKALGAGGKLVQRAGEPPGYLFSAPLTSGTVLCLGLSSQKMDGSLALARRHALYSGLTVFVLVMLALGGFAYFVPGARLGKLKELLRNASPGSGALPADAPDELGELARLINESMGRMDADRSAGVKQADESADRLRRLFQGLTERLVSGVMVLDAENRIVSVNHTFRNCLFPDAGDVQGKHLLDVVRSPGLIELIKRSSLDPDKETEEKIDGLSVKVVTVPGREIGTQAGIVIII